MAIPRDPVNVIDFEIADDAAARTVPAERRDEFRAEQIDALAPEPVAPTLPNHA